MERFWRVRSRVRALPIGHRSLVFAIMFFVGFLLFGTLLHWAADGFSELSRSIAWAAFTGAFTALFSSVILYFLEKRRMIAGPER